MVWEEARKIIYEHHSYLSSIAFTDYGESLLYPHLSKAVRYVNDLNPKINVYIATNAALPEACRRIEELADTNFDLMISIDGIGDTYERIRVNSKFDRFLANVTDISAALRGRQVFFNMVVLEDNYRQMYDVVELAGQLGNIAVQINPLNLSANSGWDLNLYDFYYGEAFQEELVRASICARQRGVKLIYPLISRLFSPSSAKDCPYFWDNFTISVDGYLKPCCGQLSTVPHFGNVFERGLMACVNSDEFIRTRTLASKDTAPAYCRGCYFLTNEIRNRAQSRKIRIKLREGLAAE
jgi:radical SAM protein with 4Fe4S-binding SPASM domain